MEILLAREQRRKQGRKAGPGHRGRGARPVEADGRRAVYNRQVRQHMEADHLSVVVTGVPDGRDAFISLPPAQAEGAADNHVLRLGPGILVAALPRCGDSLPWNRGEYVLRDQLQEEGRGRSQLDLEREIVQGPYAEFPGGPLPKVDVLGIRNVEQLIGQWGGRGGVEETPPGVHEIVSGDRPA